MNNKNNMGEKNNQDTIKEWVQVVFIAIVLAVIVKTFIFNTTLVIGESMYPTLYERDRLFVSKISPITEGYNRGDVVVLKAPDEFHKNYIKRIIGVSGDKVEIKEGKVYLNGELLKENYIEKDIYTHTYQEDEWKVPEGYVFVLGDNRQEWASKDSRFFGCVPEKILKGKVNFRYYPFNYMGKLEY